jgi:pimeloyl-ACP methyl ester carboxylesterase
VSTTERERVTVGGTALQVLKGGAGRPCVVLHGVEGDEGWLAFHEALASHATVYAPSHPGYGQTPCPPWLTTIQHQAIFYNWFLESAGLQEVDVIGVGIGGWIAAQMAVLCSAPLRRLVLVDAAGLKPECAEILDIFVTPWQQVIDRAFYAPSNAAEYQRLYATGVAEFGGAREAGRTMSMRMCFRPYMYDTSLPGMLPKIALPTLIVWGREDQIVPLECATLYQQAIPNATVRILDHCGHFAHLEQPRLLAETIGGFLNQ